MMPAKDELLKEASFKTSRSGGKGGQNVNKVSSKVELIFNVNNSTLFNDEQKALLLQKLNNRLDSEGNLHIVSQEDRSQLMNKQRSILKLQALLLQALQVQKKRKPSKIPKAVILKRLKEKSAVATKKENRKRPGLEL